MRNSTMTRCIKELFLFPACKPSPCLTVGFERVYSKGALSLYGVKDVDLEIEAPAS